MKGVGAQSTEMEGLQIVEVQQQVQRQNSLRRDAGIKQEPRLHGG